MANKEDTEQKVQLVAEEETLNKKPDLEGRFSWWSVDMIAEIDNIRFGSIQGLTYKISRELAPCCILPANQFCPTEPITLGKRGIAGSLIFLKLEKDIRHIGQIPPFNILLRAANEHGALALKSILGVELMHKGYGADIVIAEQLYTYIARAITPWESEDKLKGYIPKHVFWPEGRKTTGVEWEEQFDETNDQDIDDGMIVNPITGRKSWL